MKIVDQIEELVSKLESRGEEIGPYIHLGPDIYDELKNDLTFSRRNPYASIGNTGYVTLSIRTSAGEFRVLRSPDSHADYIGSNGRTLVDILAEEILLGN